MSREERLRVLLLDDEESLRVPLKKYLEDNFGYQVDTASHGEEAMRLMDKVGGHYDVALLDEVLVPGPDGIQVMQQVKGSYPDIEAIIFTGWGRDSRQRALQAGAFRYLEKPFDNDELAMLIRTAAQQVRLRHIGRAILSERDLDKVLKGIAEAACSLSLADEAAIVLLDHFSNRLRVYAKTYLEQPQWRTHFKAPKLSRDIIRTGQLVRVSDTRLDDRVNPRMIEAGFRSFVAVPIPGEEAHLGVLYVYGRDSGRFDSWGTVALLQTLAGQAGLAIANAQAFGQIRSHAGYMEALVQAGEGLAKTHELRKHVGLSWEFVREQLQVSTFFIALHDAQQDVLHFPLAYDEGQLVEIPNRCLGENQTKWGITGYVVKTGQELHWPTHEHALHQCSDLGIEAVQIGKPCQSCFYLPLKMGSETVGAISIQSYDRRAFNPTLLNAFRALGSQLTVALENARLVTEAQRRAADLETLQHVASTIASKLKLQDVLEQTCKAAVEFFRADHSGLVLFDCDLIQGKVVAEYPPDVKTSGTVIQLRGVPHEEKLVDVGEPLVVYDVAHEKALEPVGEMLYKRFDIRSILIVPVASKGKRLGSFSLDAIGHQRHFTQKEVELCKMFAAHVAVAMENAQLYQEAQAGFHKLRSLYEAGSAIISTMDPEHILDVVVQKACDALGGWRADVVRINETGQPVQLAALGFDESPDVGTWIRPGGISIQVVRSGEPRIIENVEAVSDTVNPGMLQDGVGAAACVPLSVGGKNIGVMWVQFEAPRRFLRAEIEALRLYANQAAIAYENARRMRILGHLRKAAEKLARMVGVQGVLRQIVRSAKEVLEADSAVIWSYDDAQDTFLPSELVADDVDTKLPDVFREDEPRTGGMARIVMREGYLAVTDVDDQMYACLGPHATELRGAIEVKALQGIALRVGDETLAVLCVNYKRPRDFAENERDTLQTFATHAALALKKANLLEQVSTARDTAKLVSEVCLLEEQQHTLSLIAGSIQGLLRCDAVTVYPYDEIKDEFEFPPAMVGVRHMGEVLRLGLVARDSVIRRMLIRNEAYVAENASSDSLMSGDFVTREEIESSIGIPLRVGDRRVGVMFVNYHTRHRFTADELTNIELFANQAAVAIRNAQLYQSEQQHVQALKAIQATSAAMSAVLNLDRLLPMITEETASVFDAAPASLMLWDAQKENLAIQAACGLSDEYVREQQIPSGRVDELVERFGPGPHVFDIGDEPIGDPDLVEREGLQNVMATPLTIGDELIGILNVYSKGEQLSFGEKDKELVTVLANHAAIAIENARSYEELKRTKGLVGARTALAWMGMANSAWRHSIEGHAINIRNAVTLLRQEMQAASIDLTSQQSAESKLDLIVRLATQILHKPITPPLSSEEGVKTVMINDLVSERIGQLWENESYQIVTRHLDLRPEANVGIRASPEWLRRALDLLVDNAVESMTSSPVRELEITTRLVKGCVEIAIRDTGTGIPPDVYSKLFGERIEQTEGGEGLGMGLLMVQAIVETYGGDILVRDTGPHGITMVILLPVEQRDSMNTG